MVLIIVTSVFPPEKGVEAQRKYNEILEKYPLPPLLNRSKWA